jgi:hypothetical protein
MSPAKKSAAPKPPREKNYIAEWYGHRVYPLVAKTEQALADQKASRCPFITQATGESHACIKAQNSRGVCTISSVSNGTRQDWLVCPFRALDDSLLDDATRRLFGHVPNVDLEIIPATVLQVPARANAVRARVKAGLPTVVYFQNKLGGEISLRATEKSPEFSFDCTMIELLPSQETGITVGKYGIFEIQTMDYHGTYKHAVNNLNSALHLHKTNFHSAVEDNKDWMSEKMEGPNLSNVFKRTFYQMMFKFQIGAHAHSAGCVFAIPKSVWDSWQKHLGAPELVDRGDGTWSLGEGTAEAASSDHPPAWIYVFDVDTVETTSPNQLNLWRVIATDAQSMSHRALDVAPAAALAEGGSVDRIKMSITSRLGKLLPEILGPRPARRPRRKATS